MKDRAEQVSRRCQRSAARAATSAGSTRALGWLKQIVEVSEAGEGSPALRAEGGRGREHAWWGVGVGGGRVERESDQRAGCQRKWRQMARLQVAGMRGPGRTPGGIWPVALPVGDERQGEWRGRGTWPVCARPGWGFVPQTMSPFSFLST